MPDGDTIDRFRTLLVTHGLQEKLFGQVVNLLSVQGLIETEVYGDSGYLGAGKREDAIIQNKNGKQIKYKVNRRPSQT